MLLGILDRNGGQNNLFRVERAPVELRFQAGNKIRGVEKRFWRRLHGLQLHANSAAESIEIVSQAMIVKRPEAKAQPVLSRYCAPAFGETGGDRSGHLNTTFAVGASR